MAKINYYRLEYKESEGQFHFESDKSHPENLAGWRTISRGIPESRCINFVEKMNSKYKGIKYSGDPQYKAPIFEIVYEEFFNKQ